MGAFRQYYKHQARDQIKSNQIKSTKSRHTKENRINKPTQLKKPLESNEKIWRPWETPPVKIEKIPFNCRFSDCDVTFKRESEMKRHESSIHDKNTEFCKLCPEVFTRKDNLTRHIKTKHKNSDHKPKCSYCKKQLSRQDAVRRHNLTCPKNPSKQIQRIPLEILEKSSIDKRYLCSESNDGER